MIRSIAACLLLLCLSSCGSTKGFRVAATPIPQAEMLEFIKPSLKAQGIDLIIIVTDDYNMPNRALSNRDIDANFFQHKPFLDEQIKQFDYSIESIASIELEPMGIYSKKISSLGDLKDNATIAVPNDPTNEARALILLQDQGLIRLDDPVNLQATVLNIIHNPKHLKFIEVDPAMLPRSLDDVDIAAINTNYALEANLSTLNDALILESKDSPYSNLLVIRTGDENRAEIMALKEALTSAEMKKFLLETYQGSVLPAF